MVAIKPLEIMEQTPTYVANSTGGIRAIPPAIGKSNQHCITPTESYDLEKEIEQATAALKIPDSPSPSDAKTITKKVTTCVGFKTPQIFLVNTFKEKLQGFIKTAKGYQDKFEQELAEQKAALMEMWNNNPLVKAISSKIEDIKEMKEKSEKAMKLAVVQIKNYIEAQKAAAMAKCSAIAGAVQDKIKILAGKWCVTEEVPQVPNSPLPDNTTSPK